MIQEKEDEIFCKRIAELSHQSYTRGICVYSWFLNLNEFNLFLRTIHNLSHATYQFWGGYQEAERRVICFYDDDSFHHVNFPISCIQIKPAHLKFSDALNHRDYLGAILNLGIDRSKIGDILIEETGAYVFVITDIAPFILDQLTKIKHTNVTLALVNGDELQIHPKTQEVFGTISSIRLDSVLSVAFNSSRSSLTGLIAGGKVFVNGRLIESNHYVPKEGDIISVRGHGKFVFRSILDKTKKDRFKVLIEKYI